MNWLGRSKSSSQKKFWNSWFTARPRHLSYWIVYSLDIQHLATFVIYICSININPLDKMNSHDPFTWTYSVSLMESNEREKQQKVRRLTFSRLAGVVTLYYLIFQLHPLIFSGCSFLWKLFFLLSWMIVWLSASFTVLFNIS